MALRDPRVRIRIVVRVIIQFSLMNGLPNFLTHGAPQELRYKRTKQFENFFWKFREELQTIFRELCIQAQAVTKECNLLLLLLV